tara:strand:+ start:3161 stop:3307 length:147 start_codon:yes stop_codon:yes gene_type:complete
MPEEVSNEIIAQEWVVRFDGTVKKQKVIIDSITEDENNQLQVDDSLEK